MHPMYTEGAVRGALRAGYQPTIRNAYASMTDAEKVSPLGLQLKAAIDGYAPSVLELREANEQARDARQWELSKQRQWKESGRRG
jgi:hypothetical protein